ncbi:MAG: FAD:protein FMN transferase, partial [Chloroflexi bacterium]
AAVDIVANLLKKHDHTQFTVDGSGDIYTTRSEIIGLEHPFDSSKIIGTASIQDKSICGSASNKRAWGEGLHHIIDPTTSKPTNEIIAAWAIADTAMHADGLATALFFVAPDILLQHIAFDYVIVHKDGRIAYSKNKDITIFTS